VIARGQFRHHAAESPVQINLAPELVREQSSTLIEHRDGAFITGGLNGQNAHDGAQYHRRADPRKGTRRATRGILPFAPTVIRIAARSQAPDGKKLLLIKRL
jgi:hypothetical protein